jgi:Glycosyl transferase family 2
MKRRAIESLKIVRSESLLLRKCSAIVAIPARDEADRISRCLAALAMQRDRLGAPIETGSFGVLLLVNNSTDETALAARNTASRLPYPLEVVDVSLSQNATAGGARRRAMEEAADRLRKGVGDGVLLTTDADSVVSPSWYADSMSHLELGADCVAGYIDAEPAEIVSHGAVFLARGRLEDTYLRLVAEIYALCDPRPHDPWPNHRVSSGASLAVKLAAYKAVGGMPDKALGEDGAFTALLDENGFKVRHALDVSVLTSCRLDGRASGGAADTMRHRRDVPDAPCDDELEPAFATLRRATIRGFLRKARQERKLQQAISRILGAGGLGREPSGTFANVWREIEARHPKLQRGLPLRPSDLPRQIAAAEFIVRHLRFNSQRTGAQDDRRPRAESRALVGA